MRRTMLVGAVVLVMAWGFLALRHAVLQAQSTKTPPAIDAPTATIVVSPFGADSARTDDAKAQALDALPIRQRFIELSKKKAYALNEEQLKREVEGMEKEVKELEAWAKADEAVRLLHEVILKHPNTKAAEAANAAIQVIEGQRSGQVPVTQQFLSAPEPFNSPPGNPAAPDRRPISP
jgi:hypothetical protein